MSDAPTTWSSAGLAARLEGTRFSEVRCFAELDSTNRWLIEQARAGAPEGMVAVADHQTAGRGRLGRTWTAPPGASLLVSVLARPPLPPARAQVVTMAAGLAAADAVAAVAGVEARVKWPNDLLVGTRKLAGMLAEADVSGGRLRALVVGLGVNVNWDAFPDHLVDTATACNVEAGRPVDRTDLLVAWLLALHHRYDAVHVDPDTACRRVLDEYRRRCDTVGRDVRVDRGAAGHDGEPHRGSTTLLGRAEGIGEGGELLVRADNGALVSVTVGDAVHVRPARL